MNVSDPEAGMSALLMNKVLRSSSFQSARVVMNFCCALPCCGGLQAPCERGLDGGLWHRGGRKVAANLAPQFWSVAAVFSEFKGVVKQLMGL